eukprot:gene36310-biopygen1682
MPSLGSYKWLPTLNPPVAPPLPDKFRMVYLNADGFKFAELLMFMALEAVDCMVLIDVRVAKERVAFLRREARAQLGPRAECLVSVPVEDSRKGAPPLSIKGSTATPLDYTRDTIQHWAQRHMSTPGNHSICGGDFNSLWHFDEDCGGGGYRAPLQDWSTGVGWGSRSDNLPLLQKCVTRPSSQLTGGSEIDHVLYNSSAIRIRRYYIGTDSLRRLLNEFTDDTDLKYCDFGVPALSLKKPADLHHYVTHMFRNHFSAEQTLAPALQDGTVSWESLQTMSFAEFRALHSGLNIPVTADSDPLLALWNAFHYSPSRDVVFAALHPLLNQGPPLEKFAAVIKSKQGNSSGCPSGLQYKHLQHWQPQMIAEAYECLATIEKGSQLKLLNGLST